MMIQLVLLFMLIASPCYGFSESFLGATQAGCNDKSGMIMWEDFEGTGYQDADWTEDCAGGTCNEDDTTATPMQGTHDLLLTYSSGNTRTVNALPSTYSDIWVHVGLKFVDATPTPNQYILSLRNSTTNYFFLYLQSSGVLAATHGTITDTSMSGTLSNDTWYHVWIHYTTTGTGTVYIGETNIFSEATTYSFTTGDAITGIDNIRLYLTSTSTAVYYDKIRTKATSIGDVCP